MLLTDEGKNAAKPKRSNSSKKLDKEKAEKEKIAKEKKDKFKSKIAWNVSSPKEKHILLQ